LSDLKGILTSLSLRFSENEREEDEKNEENKENPDLESVQENGQKEDEEKKEENPIGFVRENKFNVASHFLYQMDVEENPFHPLLSKFAADIPTRDLPIPQSPSEAIHILSRRVEESITISSSFQSALTAYANLTEGLPPHPKVEGLEEEEEEKESDLMNGSDAFSDNRILSKFRDDHPHISEICFRLNQWMTLEFSIDKVDEREHKSLLSRSFLWVLFLF